MNNAISGTYQDGQIILRNPVDWPDGACVEVTLVGSANGKLGMTEDEWPTTPEGIAVLLARMDKQEPLEFTPEEVADLKAWRQKLKEYNIVKSQQRIERLFE